MDNDPQIMSAGILFPQAEEKVTETENRMNHFYEGSVLQSLQDSNTAFAAAEIRRAATNCLWTGMKGTLVMHGSR